MYILSFAIDFVVYQDIPGRRDGKLSSGAFQAVREHCVISLTWIKWWSQKAKSFKSHGALTGRAGSIYRFIQHQETRSIAISTYWEGRQQPKVNQNEIKIGPVREVTEKISVRLYLVFIHSCNSHDRHPKWCVFQNLSWIRCVDKYRRVVIYILHSYLYVRINWVLMSGSGLQDENYKKNLS